MGVSYRKLWVKLAEKDMKRTDLKEVANISSNTLAKMGKNDYVSLAVLERICEVFDCEIGDIIELNHDAKEAR